MNKFDLFDEPYTFKLFQSENKYTFLKKTSLCRDYCKNLLNHCQKNRLIISENVVKMLGQLQM